MAVPTSWNYLAALSPALPVASALRSFALDPSTGLTTTAAKVVPGANGPGSLSTPFNANAVREDLIGRYPTGAYAIVEGLDLIEMAGVQSIKIAHPADTTWGGVVTLDAAQPVMNPIVKPLGAGDNFLWLDRTLSVQITTAYNLVPGVPAAYLGRVHVAGGVADEIDRSGVLLALAGGLYRRTGDNDLPTDTPPSRYILLSESKSGIFRWNGRFWEAPAQKGRAVVAMSDPANTTLAAANWRTRVLSLTGTLTAARDLILPNIDGLFYRISNQTTGGFSVTAKVLGQTGVSVAAGKRALIHCNGVDYVRETLDA